MKSTDAPVGPDHESTATIDALIARLRAADDDGREAIKDELRTLAGGPDGARVRGHIEVAMKEEVLDVQWELEEVLEATAPPPPAPAPDDAPKPEAAEEPEEEEEDDPNRPLTAADLRMVYDDPRGLMLHRSKKGDRWFATQVDPRTSTPQTFELHATEIDQIKTQLEGSPYWLLGA